MIIYGFPPNLQANKNGLKQFIYLLWRAFPDIRITFDDIIIEGDKVAGIYNLTGTHKGKFMDLQPTNKQFRVDAMTVFCFRDTKCIEHWNLVDMMSLIEQLRTLILELFIRQIPNPKINLLKKKRIGIRRSGRRPNLRFQTKY